MRDAVKVSGLAEFSRSLKRLDADLPKSLRLALNEAAGLVVDNAKPGVPRKSGRAQGSIRARSTRTAVRVTEGSARAPYMPWLDYGGRVGPGKSIVRPFIRKGRYVYPAYYAARDSGKFEEILSKALTGVARQAGLEVT